ncbi:unnamed protein product [Rotaria sordida]|uniref:Uncharacterized protein n=1 Tax=Rotaria sordida TaxID=392033 RepID=A0A819LFP9_9BILA|nr:unnamed protein product [Rotaria sordida]
MQQNKRYQQKILAARYSIHCVKDNSVEKVSEQFIMTEVQQDSLSNQELIRLENDPNTQTEISLNGNIDPDINDLSSENDASSHDSQLDYSSDENEASSHDSQSDYSSDENEATHDQIEIERKTFLQQLIEFIRDANLNKTATSSLLSLLNSSKSYDEIPVSINQLLKQLDIKFYYDIFIYCSTCLTSLSKIQDRCINCETSTKKTNSELIIFSIAEELRRVVQSNIELIKWYSFRENQMISDIVLGDIYKEQCSNNSTLTLMITTDGKPMISSKATRTSVWPVMSFLVEIPPFIRERLDNMMLLGLWHSPISPPTDLLLSRIVYLIKSLTMTGIDILVGKKNYRQEFDLVYKQTFGEFPPQSMKFYSRYVHGLIVYHSMSYSRRNKSNSFSVLIETRNLRVLFKYPMAYYSGSRTPSATRKSSYTGVSTHSKPVDDYEIEVEGENDLDNDYPIIRDVPFYNSQQRRCVDSQSNRNTISEKDRYYTPQLKRKRGSEAIDRFPFDSFAKQLENMQTMMCDMSRKVDMMNPTPSPVPSDVPKVMYNERNILAGPIEPTPLGLMKQLINDLFTEDEIILGYHEEVNERTNKIKEAVKNYYFRDDDEHFRVFWDSVGHITRGNQRRGRAHRKKKNDLEQQKLVQLNTTASDINDGDQNKN